MDPLGLTRDSRLHPANQLRRRRRLSNRPERWWPPFFGTHKVWYLEKGKTVTGLYYAELLARRNAENTAPFGEEKSDLPSWQRTGSHFRPRQGQVGQIGLRTATPFTIFSRFGPMLLEWGGRRRHRGLFCRPREIGFFRRVKEVGASVSS